MRDWMKDTAGGREPLSGCGEISRSQYRPRHAHARKSGQKFNRVNEVAPEDLEDELEDDCIDETFEEAPEEILEIEHHAMAVTRRPETRYSMCDKREATSAARPSHRRRRRMRVSSG